jgi:hypothetical protein
MFRDLALEDELDGDRDSLLLHERAHDKAEPASAEVVDDHVLGLEKGVERVTGKMSGRGARQAVWLLLLLLLTTLVLRRSRECVVERCLRNQARSRTSTVRDRGQRRTKRWRSARKAQKLRKPFTAELNLLGVLVVPGRRH